MRTSKSLQIVCSVVLTMLLVAAAALDSRTPGAQAAWKILRVTPNGGVSPCGETWDSACSLQSALIAADSGDEIWVAAGTYLPGSFGALTATFQLVEWVGVYGGFDGTETARDQRNWQQNVTILSGDLNANGLDANDSYHVVTGANNAILDGFTITGGNAIGSNKDEYIGGGMYNNNSSPTLTNVIFSGNAAAGGGGMFNQSSSPSLTNVTFSGNAAEFGGGIFNANSKLVMVDVTFFDNKAFLGGGLYTYASSAQLKDVTFKDNTADYGGGLYINFSSPEMTNITFTGNTAGSGGAVYGYESYPEMTNNLFQGNTAEYGAGMYSENSGPVLTNATFSSNTAEFDGGALFTDGGSPVVRSSILWGNTGGEIAGDPATVTFSIVAGGYPGSLDADPRFASVADLHLAPGSPAIDAGDPASCPLFDLDGLPRPVDGDHDGQAVCDMGAFESDGLRYVYLPLAIGPRPVYTVTGQVTVDGQPLPGVTVTVSGGAVAVTDAQGRFVLRLYAGTYTLTPSKPEYTFSPAAHTVSLPPDAAELDFAATENHTELVQNGGFEARHGWTFPVTLVPAGYSNVRAHTGDWSVRTGIDDPGQNVNSYSSIWQQVTLPAEMDRAILSFWLYSFSTEASLASFPALLPGDFLDQLNTQSFAVDLVGDAQWVLILDKDGLILEKLVEQRRSSLSWEKWTVDLTKYKGQTIRLYFGTYNNGIDGVTWMFVDDVSLKAYPPR